jgi:hypothetical protein
MRFFRLTAFFMFVAIIAGCSSGGSGGSGKDKDPMGTLLVSIEDSADNTAISAASVAVYDSSNLLVTKGATDNSGEFEYSLSPGTYYIKVAAQGYLPVPPTNQEALPFEIIDDQDTIQDVALDEHPDAGNTSQISGYVLTSDSVGVPGVLVVARDETLNLTASAISGPDGEYELYNVNSGTYTLKVYCAGYRDISDPYSVDVVAGGSYEADDIEVVVHANADLSGHISFLAVANGIVDVTLIHPDTLDTIPGLSTENDASTNTYLLEAVPPGIYIAWASFRNDGYVMDPDRISKFGLPLVTYTTASIDQEQDFEVTGAVSIDAPTNGADLVVPEVVNTATPKFTWESYPSAKEYIIEVFNSKGETIWGGFDSSNIVRHTQIGQQDDSAEFNFDSSATAALQDGETYRWKVYADDDDAVDVQNLISSSEDQMGLFKYVQDSTP